jgi:hypothetical protein
MFEVLCDKISLLWVRRWPTVSGEVTEILAERLSHGNKGDTLRLSVAYKFSVGSDGPYTGEDFWRPIFCTVRRVRGARRKIHVRQRVLIRYRADDPSVNTLHPQVWRNL